MNTVDSKIENTEKKYFSGFNRWESFNKRALAVKFIITDLNQILIFHLQHTETYI